MSGTASQLNVSARLSAGASSGLSQFEHVAHVALVVAAFSLPLPMLLLSVSSAVFLVAWLLAGRFGLRWERLREDRVAQLAAALLVLVCLGVAWSPAPLRSAADGAAHYRGLLLLVLARTLVTDGRWALRIALGFVAGVAVALAVAYFRMVGPFGAAFEGMCSYGGECGRIGFSLQLALLCVTAYGLWSSWPRLRALWLVVGLAATYFLFFLNNGRTGQLAFLLLLPLLLYRWRGYRGAAAGLALAIAAALAVFALSGTVRSRVDLAAANFQRMSSGDNDSSEGQRFEMVTNVTRLIARHPLFGGGTGSLAVEYPEIVRDTPGAALVHVANAHNDYLMLWTQVGIAGPALLILFWVMLWRGDQRQTEASRWLTRALVVVFVSGTLFNSLLLDARESHTLALLIVAFGLGWPSGRAGVQRRAAS
jgi:O-antigen ligase